jgi:hypothetical protein
MLNILRTLVVIAVFMLNSNTADAASSPISLAVVPPVQFPPSDFSVPGLRLSLIYGQHRDVYGIDIGVLGNVTEQDFVGLAVAGGMNVTRGTTKALGLQGAGLANLNYGKTRVVGVQLAGVANYNQAESSLAGVQLALVNLADYTNVYGIQAGVYNRAKAVYGFQIGLVNVTTNLHGLQIGLVNVHHQGIFKVCPILNVGF